MEVFAARKAAGVTADGVGFSVSFSFGLGCLDAVIEAIGAQSRKSIRV